MLTSLRGIYENGAVHLTEPAPATLTPIEVVVVFLEATDQRGFVEVPANAPTELAQIFPRTEHMVRLEASWRHARELIAGMMGPTLSEEIVADRQEDN